MVSCTVKLILEYNRRWSDYTVIIVLRLFKIKLLLIDNKIKSLWYCVVKFNEDIKTFTINDSTWLYVASQNYDLSLWKKWIRILNLKEKSR